MSAISGEEYLTVAEASRALKVSRSTLWRWIDHGVIPAYRLGQRRVLLKEADLSRLIADARPGKGERGGPVQGEWERLSVPLTTKEQRRALEALEAAERLQEQLAARYGHDGFSDSVELLNDARSERTEQLS